MPWLAKTEYAETILSKDISEPFEPPIADIPFFSGVEFVNFPTNLVEFSMPTDSAAAIA